MIKVKVYVWRIESGKKFKCPSQEIEYESEEAMRRDIILNELVNPGYRLMAVILEDTGIENVVELAKQAVSGGK